MRPSFLMMNQLTRPLALVANEQLGAERGELAQAVPAPDQAHGRDRRPEAPWTTTMSLSITCAWLTRKGDGARWPVVSFRWRVRMRPQPSANGHLWQALTRAWQAGCRARRSNRWRAAPVS